MIGTNTSVFNTILASRSPPHLQAVFEQYRKLSQQDIEGAIKDETSGNLCKAFLAVGRNFVCFRINLQIYSYSLWILLNTDKVTLYMYQSQNILI